MISCEQEEAPGMSAHLQPSVCAHWDFQGLSTKVILDIPSFLSPDSPRQLAPLFA